MIAGALREIHKKEGFVVLEVCCPDGTKFILIAGDFVDVNRFWQSGWRKFQVYRTRRGVEFTLAESGNVPANAPFGRFSGKVEDWQGVCESGYEKECEIFTQKCREWLGTEYKP